MADAIDDVGALRRAALTLEEAGLELHMVVARVRRAIEVEELRALAREAGPDIAAAQVRALVAARRLWRDGFQLGPGDPAWALLLELLAARLEGAKVSVTALGTAAGLAPATAHRWITRLLDAGLVARRPHREDERMVLMTLTEEGEDRLRAYLAAALRLSLCVA